MQSPVKLVLLAVILAAVVSARADWVRKPTKSLAWLHDITFINADEGWIVGSDGTVLRTTDGGVKWMPLKKMSGDNLLQIRFTDERTGWMLCERNIYGRGGKAVSYLLKTVDRGASWESVEFEQLARDRITRLVFDRSGAGTAIGERGVIYRLQADGKTWKRQPAPVGYLLLSGSFSGDGTGALGGAAGTIMFTEDDGRVWDKATVFGDAAARINSVFFASQRLGWAVGSGGAVFAATGGGRLWRQQESGTRVDLNDVFFVDTHTGWIVGDDGVILHTENGGRTWVATDSHVRHRLERVFFTGRRGWAVGFGGTLLYNDADAG